MYFNAQKIAYVNRRSSSVVCSSCLLIQDSEIWFYAANRGGAKLPLKICNSICRMAVEDICFGYVEPGLHYRIGQSVLRHWEQYASPKGKDAEVSHVQLWGECGEVVSVCMGVAIFFGKLSMRACRMLNIMIKPKKCQLFETICSTCVSFLRHLGL